MMQETHLPDPEQLKTWAREMIPFTSGGSADLTKIDDEMYLVRTDEEDTFDVEYRFKPTYIIVETSRDEWEDASEVSWADIDHSVAWDNHLNLEKGEDFYCARGRCPGAPEPAEFEAFWILEQAIITRHEA